MKNWKECPKCKGKGQYLTSRDCHESEGLVPCYTKPNKLLHEMSNLNTKAGHKIACMKYNGPYSKPMYTGRLAGEDYWRFWNEYGEHALGDTTLDVVIKRA